MNLVLTSIYGLSTEIVEPFFYSLRLSGYTDQTVAIVTHITDDCRSMLTRYEATVIESEYHGLPMTYASLARRLRLAPGAIYRAYWKHRRDVRCLLVNCWRFFRFQEYLQHTAASPAFVLLADVRDVVFQGNPFSYAFPPGLSAASERAGGTIGQSRGNSKWLWEAAGTRELRRLADRTPVCSGTIVADGPTMRRYLDLMTEYLRRRFFWGLFDAIDQGLHNYFVHNRMITPLRVFENWDGPFLTLDSEVVTPERKTPEGFLCNRDGTRVPIVHQYDRVRDLYREGEPRPACWKFYRA
jgi:hypothetical protein